MVKQALGDIDVDLRRFDGPVVKQEGQDCALQTAIGHFENLANQELMKDPVGRSYQAQVFRLDSRFEPENQTQDVSDDMKIQGKLFSNKAGPNSFVTY